MNIEQLTGVKRSKKKTMLYFILFMLLSEPQQLLADFSNPSELNNWTVVNDGVMGGKSNGQFGLTQEGNALFSGDVSLQNYGGFTSVRSSFKSKPIKGLKKVFIKLKGDKKNYQFRIKSEVEDKHSYKYEFSTTGEWEVIEIDLINMTPTYRGYRPNLPNYQPEYLSQIGFLIANKKEESFQLEISQIWLQ